MCAPYRRPPCVCPPPRFRLFATIAVFVGIVITAATDWLPLVHSAIIGAWLLIGLRVITLSEAFFSLQPRALLTVIAAFGLGRALDESGLDAVLVGKLHSALQSGGNPPPHTTGRWSAACVSLCYCVYLSA